MAMLLNKTRPSCDSSSRGRLCCGAPFSFAWPFRFKPGRGSRCRRRGLCSWWSALARLSSFEPDRSLLGAIYPSFLTWRGGFNSLFQPVWLSLFKPGLTPACAEHTLKVQGVCSDFQPDRVCGPGPGGRAALSRLFLYLADLTYRRPVLFWTPPHAVSLLNEMQRHCAELQRCFKASARKSCPYHFSLLAAPWVPRGLVSLGLNNLTLSCGAAMLSHAPP